MFERKKQIPLNDNYDVIVAGGGPAGCAAAIAAAREGSKTLLIEATFALGGMSTQGLVTAIGGYHDQEKIIAKGIAGELLYILKDKTPSLKKQLKKAPLSIPCPDPEPLKRIFDSMVIEAGADILFGSQLCDVENSSDDEVGNILVSNKAGLTAYKAKAYIDCTGDGDLAAWAGAEFEKGDANGNLQPATNCFVMTNIDEYALNNGPGISFDAPEGPIQKAVHSQKFPLIFDLHSCSSYINSRTYAFNTGHLYDVDNTSPKNLSESVIKGRKLVGEYQAAFAEFHPAFKNAFVSNTGALLGIRETRRIIGDYIVTMDDYLGKRSFPDEICRSAYGADVHSKEDSISYTKMTIEEIYKKIDTIVQSLEPGESFGVPYRCLTPKGLKNVLVAGRCISSGRRANGSVRVMACCLNTGEAAGIAAAMTAKKGINDVHQINTNELRNILKSYGAYLP